MKKTLIISILLIVILLTYFISKLIISHYQGTDIKREIHGITNMERFVRCGLDYEKNLHPFIFRQNKNVMCTILPEFTIVVGLIAEDSLLTTYIHHLLSLGTYYCDVEAVQFETFTLDQINYFEKHSLYPPHVSGWLLIGKHFEVSPWKGITKYGRIGLGSENCANGWSPKFHHNPPLFGLLTYGDCTIVDNIDFFTFPLGPLFEGNRDFPFFQPSSIRTKDRPYDINGQFTITPQKPSRKECIVYAQELCKNSSLQCNLGTDWTYFLPSVLKDSNSYFKQLEHTKYVLCPAGNNFEQYRIWEAILAGAIPIVEDGTSDVTLPTYVSPAYANDFYCLPSDVHYLLKQANAPVLFVKNWSELPLLTLKGNGQQTRLLKWRETFFMHFKLLIVELTLKHFYSSL